MCYSYDFKMNGIKMYRKGNCYSNCIMETFFERMKNELYDGFNEDYKSFKEFSKAVNDI